jgi:3-oxoacyl-[acyl-carrier protein] reductase
MEPDPGACHRYLKKLQPVMSNPLKDKNIIITGATRGIGVGIAYELALLGANLTLGYLENDGAAQALKQQLSEKFHTPVLFKGDMTNPDGASGIVKAAFDSHNHVDALVSNLGPFLWKLIAEMSVDEWDHMIRANLSAHFYLVRELLPQMRERKEGNFVFIGGVGSGGITGHPRSSAYNSAKVGLAEFVRTLAIEEGPHGIRANMIAPGVIDNGEYTDGYKERIVEEIPLGYVGEPADIGKAVAWLLSPDSRYVTGAIIDISGGYHLTMR